MNPYFRALLFAFCFIQLLLAVAFLFQHPFAVQLWPLPDTTPMSFIFLASIFAAAAAATLWGLVTKEYAALTGVALDYVAIFFPIALFGFQLAASTGSGALMLFTVMCTGAVIVGVPIMLWSARQPVRDTRPMPPLVRWSFGVFVIALIIGGIVLIFKTPNMLPWRVTPEISVLIGWFFLGAATYFAYGIIRPGWWNTAGQLAGFLAYDLILVVPFIQRLPTIAPELRLGLIIYLTIVIYSGLLAIYYLFIHPETRIIRR
ncbi:MAG: hypothetical protein H7X77_09325 [Anaerolineae bacterium]|nr:hypothetical protein [Anaerolineae bacterium]